MLNPYVEILARALYNRDVNPIFIPFEECTKEQYEDTCKLVKDIDLKLIKEETDTTNRIEIIACAGGACEIT